MRYGGPNLPANERGRRAIRVHLPADVDRGMEALRAALRSAVSLVKQPMR